MSQPIEPEKRVALVTGGSKRVGRAIVEMLAATGFFVLFTYNDSEDAAEELVELGLGEAIKCDLGKPHEAAEHLKNSVALWANRLDVLVHNASFWQPGDLDSLTQESIEKSLAVHVTSPLLITQAFAPMLRGSSGHVVTMLDEMIDRGWPGYIAYTAAKSALASATMSLARELAPDVTVNGIAPGVVNWPDKTPESFKTQYLSRVPLGRPGTPQDVANLVRFLITDGRYMTGQILRLDGGRSVT